MKLVRREKLNPTCYLNGDGMEIWEDAGSLVIAEDEIRYFTEDGIGHYPIPDEMAEAIINTVQYAQELEAKLEFQEKFANQKLDFTTLMRLAKEFSADDIVKLHKAGLI